MGGRGVKLCQLCFQMLIDQQQGSHRPAEIAVAARNYFIDRGLARSEAHQKSLQFPVQPITNASSRFCERRGKGHP
jgi:hypothetical protein